MLEVLGILNRSFQEFLDQGDERLKDYPLMQSPFGGLAMIVAYVYFVKVAGPQFMKKRKPYELRNVMAIYNFVLVLINLYLFLGIGWYGYFNGYSLKCQSIDYSYNYDAVMMALMGYYFYLTKFIEFADTIFFVLRKKDNQISALHVIHHSVVPFSLWFGVKFASGGYNAFFPFLNSFVHVIMYSYYGLAALGEKYKKYLFWKKYMTYLQLAQFVVVIVYAISMWYHQCDISTTFLVMNFIHAVLFFFLFLNFFIQTYNRRNLLKAKKTRVCSEETSKEPLEKLEADSKESHVRHLVHQLKKESDSHVAQLHSCASEACCNANCITSTSQYQKRNGKVYNDSIPNTLNGYRRTNGLSGSEPLRNGKKHAE